MSDRWHLRHIGALLLLATAVQAWMLHHNPMPAPDAIGFIRLARQFTWQPLREAVAHSNLHPLFPLLVWQHHELFRSELSFGGEGWIESARFVAALASVLVVLPMYLAGTCIAESPMPFGATAAFCVLPLASRLGAEAISDSTYLLCFLTGFWAALEFITTTRAAWLLLAGVAAGAASLARVEGLMLPVAIAAAVAVLQIKPTCRIAWSRVGLGAMCLTAGLGAVLGPYESVTGKLLPKHAIARFVGDSRVDSANATAAAAGESRPTMLSDGQPIAPPLVRVALPDLPGGLKFPLRQQSSDDAIHSHFAAATRFGHEILDGLMWILGAWAFFGLWREPMRPAKSLVAMTVLVFSLGTIHYASRVGYLSSRHVLTPVCLAMFASARGGWKVAARLSRRWNRLTKRNEELEPRCHLVWAGILLGFIACIGLARTATPLHAARLAERDAGRWMADQSVAGSLALDTWGFVSLYSGLRSYDFHKARVAFEDPRLEFVIIERHEREAADARGATLRHLLDRGGELLRDFPPPSGHGDWVEIYRWHSERLLETGAKPERGAGS